MIYYKYIVGVVITIKKAILIVSSVFIILYLSLLLYGTSEGLINNNENTEIILIDMVERKYEILKYNLEKDQITILLDALENEIECSYTLKDSDYGAITKKNQIIVKFKDRLDHMK